MKVYSQKDAKMTQGFAILCMLVLHLFCRTGDSVLGTPLIWLTDEKPLAYCFGFFAEICVPIYSICAGYARQIKAEGLYKNNLRRAFKLLKNYWIVLCLFSVIGMMVGGSVPGDIKTFLLNVILLKSYQGAWWYLNTYILLLLIPNEIVLLPVKILKAGQGVACCLGIQVGWYFVGRLGIWPSIGNNVVLEFALKEAENLIGVLPYFWMGALICKGKLLSKVKEKLEQGVGKKNERTVLLVIALGTFVGFNIAHKAVLIGLVSLSSFFLFVLFPKEEIVKKIFLFLGKHSTNIWLTHMFFYCVDPFNGLVQKAQYPLIMLLFMLILCIVSSYVIIGISRLIDRIGKGFLP